MNVTIYGKQDCVYCREAINLVDKYLYIDVEYKQLDKDYTREQFKQLFPEAKTFPQVIVDDMHIGGYNDLLKHILYTYS